MPNRGRATLTVVLAFAAVAFFSLPSLAQTSSDYPGGSSSLQPVGVGEIASPANASTSTIWTAIGLVLRDRVVPFPWIWLRIDRQRNQPSVVPLRLAVPRKVYAIER